MFIKKSCFLLICICILIISNVISVLPPDGSIVALRSGCHYLSYANPESESIDGTIKIISMRGISPEDPYCQFILTVLDEQAGSFILERSDLNGYVQSQCIVISTNSNTSPGDPITLFYDGNGHISSTIDVTSDIIWNPIQNLSNQIIRTHPDCLGWTLGAIAYWLIISPCLLRNNISNGHFFPTPITQAAIFTFEIIS